MANRWENRWADRWGKSFIWGDSKITADGDCSHEIKRHLLIRRKAITNSDSILKSRAITLPTKVCLVKLRFLSGQATVFPVVNKWQQPTPAFLPGKFQGQRCLTSYSPQGCKESASTTYSHTYKLLPMPQKLGTT